jgi:tetraprenyl-beta-curcumene synthase
MSFARAFVALVRANAVFWPGIRPVVHRQLRYWSVQAHRIPDSRLRSCALRKLRDEQLNCEVAATLSTLVPARDRHAVIAATVALEVMYDYLDGITELPNPDRLSNGRHLFRALLAAVSAEPARSDYFRYCPGEDTAPSGATLTWWEYAAGGAASVLTLHALLAAAAHPAATELDARNIDAAYLPLCALSTLLDGLADRARDSEAHCFIDYYDSEQYMIERLVAISALATASVASLRDAGHHTMTVAGIAAYFLSAPLTQDTRALADQLLTTLRPLILPLLPLFRLWRSATLVAQRRTAVHHEALQTARLADDSNFRPLTGP